MNGLLNEVKQLHEQIIEWRRHFHQNAELSFEEYKTSDFIEEKLKSCLLYTSRRTPTAICNA